MPGPDPTYSIRTCMHVHATGLHLDISWGINGFKKKVITRSVCKLSVGVTSTAQTTS